MTQSLICDLRGDKVSAINFVSLNKFIKEKLNDSGTVWIITNCQYKDHVVQVKFFDICNKIHGLLLKNIILTYNHEIKNKYHLFNDNVEHILFFSKSKKYFLNKDPIREKHIWKDVEWGKRKKNYNPKGKDPGNVWIKTNDDGKGNITQHLPVTNTEVIERIIKCSSNEKDTISTYGLNINDSHNRIIHEERF
mgnify:CR=1 FL=1|tara:strand:- start:354 stop:932 length:579 start_codon:yes stop_codon:yes gene_type:complete